MSLLLSPALGRFTREAAIICRLLTGYSALEYQLCLCAGMGGGDVARAITDFFSKRVGETKRVRLANELGRAAYAAAGLGEQIDVAIDDTLLCVQIRNQYAHCIWHDHKGQLAIAHMEEIAAPSSPGADPGNLKWRNVDVVLLHEQEQFFVSTKDRLNYLNHKIRQRVGDIASGAAIREPAVAQHPRMHL